MKRGYNFIKERCNNKKIHVHKKPRIHSVKNNIKNLYLPLECLSIIFTFCDNIDIFKWQSISKYWLKNILNTIDDIEGYYLPKEDILPRLKGLKKFQFCKKKYPLNIHLNNNILSQISTTLTHLIIGGDYYFKSLHFDDDIISNLINLQHLDISTTYNIKGTCFKNINQHLKKLKLTKVHNFVFENLKFLTNLTCLKIEDNRSWDAAKEENNDILLPNLEHLLLKKYDFMKGYCLMLEKMTNIKKLTIDEVYYSLPFKSKIKIKIFHLLSNLETLKINNTTLFSNKNLSHMTQLKKLYLGDINTDIKNSTLSKMTNLECLELTILKKKHLALPICLKKIKLNGILDENLKGQTITDFALLTNLTHIELSNLTSFIYIANLSKIRSIFLYNLNYGIVILENLISLETLKLYKVHCELNFREIKKSSNLKKLIVNKSNFDFLQAVDIKSLSNFIYNNKSININNLKSLIKH